MPRYPYLSRYFAVLKSGLFALTMCFLSGCITISSAPSTSLQEDNASERLSTSEQTIQEAPLVSGDSVLYEADSLALDHPGASNELEHSGNRLDMLKDEASNWYGTPHHWGGTTHSGIDCSALVQRLYQDVFSLSLPRTTREQAKIGKAVSRRGLEIGDLVFYRINSRTRHVGIYMGQDQLLHASKSTGVAISSMNDRYWKRRYWMARRVLPPDTLPASEVVPPQSERSDRISW